jgi:hypothetical protein
MATILWQFSVTGNAFLCLKIASWPIF